MVWRCGRLGVVDGLSPFGLESVSGAVAQQRQLNGLQYDSSSVYSWRFICIEHGNLKRSDPAKSGAEGAAVIKNTKKKETAAAKNASPNPELQTQPEARHPTPDAR